MVVFFLTEKEIPYTLVKSEGLFIEVYFMLSTVLGALRHVKTDGLGPCQQDRPKM